MDLRNILVKAGSAVLSSVIPGGGLVVELINSFLPGDKKLPKTATGDQATNAIQSLPPDKQLELFTKELDVEIEGIKSFTQVQQALAQADATGSSTRPKIAQQMSTTVCFVIISFSTILIIAILLDRIVMIKNVENLWPLALTIIGTPTVLLRQYFGKRTEEKKARYELAGKPPDPGLLENIVGLFKK